MHYEEKKKKSTPREKNNKERRYTSFHLTDHDHCFTSFLSFLCSLQPYYVRHSKAICFQDNRHRCMRNAVQIIGPWLMVLAIKAQGYS